MIRTESEYREAQRQLADGRQVAEQQRAGLAARGLTSDEVVAALEPLLAFQAGIAEEARLYECLRCIRRFAPRTNPGRQSRPPGRRA